MVTIKEQTFYRVDAHRTGTCGWQETFKSQKEAEKRAGEIAAHFGTNGKEGLSFPTELRGMALTADKMLRPYGRTLLQAAEFYRAHLDADQQRKDSTPVPVLAQEWHESKKGGGTKHLRATTLKGIMESAEIPRWAWSECCACASCNSDTPWPTKPWRVRSMTAAQRVPSWVVAARS